MPGGHGRRSRKPRSAARTKKALRRMAWQTPTLPDPFFTGYQLRGSQTVGDKRKEKRINFMTTSFSLRSFTVKLSTFVVDNSVCLMVKSPQTHYRHWHGKAWLNFIQIWFHSLAWHSPPFFRIPIAFWCIFLKRWLMEWLNKKNASEWLAGFDSAFRYDFSLTKKSLRLFFFLNS